MQINYFPSKTFSLGCVVASLVSLVSADQPVHCLKSQIAGFWTFEVSSESVKADLGQSESICTHELPNK